MCYFATRVVVEVALGRKVSRCIVHTIYTSPSNGLEMGTPTTIPRTVIAIVPLAIRPCAARVVIR